MVMNFEHIATRIPMNVRMTFWEVVLYNIGFKDKAIDSVMTRYQIMDEEYSEQDYPRSLFV